MARHDRKGAGAATNEQRGFGLTQRQIPVVGQGTGHLDDEPRPLAIAALRFLLRWPNIVVIPKASSPEHAAENAGAGDLRLSSIELSRIDQAFPRGPKPRKLPVI